MAFGKRKEDGFVVVEGASVIESGMLIEGELISGSTSMVIRGIIKSDLEVEADVTVDHEGILEGDITCINCTIKGKVMGNISATGHLCLTDEGSVLGDITCSTLEVTKGASFTGTCNKPRNPITIKSETHQIEANLDLEDKEIKKTSKNKKEENYEPFDNIKLVDEK